MLRTHDLTFFYCQQSTCVFSTMFRAPLRENPLCTWMTIARMTPGRTPSLTAAVTTWLPPSPSSAANVLVTFCHTDAHSMATAVEIYTTETMKYLTGHRVKPR